MYLKIGGQTEFPAYPLKCSRLMRIRSEARFLHLMNHYTGPMTNPLVRVLVPHPSDAI